MSTTTDSDPDEPIFPDRAKDMVLDGPDQLWVADLTYVAIIGGFAYVAIILDAWSRRVVGYAIGRSIEARLAVAALKGGGRATTPADGLRPSFGSWIAIRVGDLPGAAGSPRHRRIDEPARQSL